MSDPLSNTIIVAALYKFTRFGEPAVLRVGLEGVCRASDVFGSLLLAPEGINGTIAGSRQGIDAVLRYIRSLPGCADLEWKESRAAAMPFKRMKVRLKREIVTMGMEGVDPTVDVGSYVSPREWNALIADPNVVVVDTRNDYEVAIGTFKGAIDPGTEAFSDFPAWAESRLDKSMKVAMFCTGGIRCEKATALLKSRGFPEVFHLKGGILKYLEDVPEAESLWRGECFVFDERVSVGHGLEPGPYQLCSICRLPFLSGEGGGGYAREICARCDSEADPETKAAAAERTRQIAIAESRGEKHVGGPMRRSGRDVDGD
ncbi:MAG: hypothetical protein RLZ98_2191 [Pseudomonadota bacterium]|jgi:UPF0176 protein